MEIEENEIAIVSANESPPGPGGPPRLPGAERGSVALPIALEIPRNGAAPDPPAASWCSPHVLDRPACPATGERT